MINLHEINKETSQQKILTMKDVIRITTPSRSTIHRLSELGLFPKSINISAHRIGFINADINFWITTKPRITD